MKLNEMFGPGFASHDRQEKNAYVGQLHDAVFKAMENMDSLESLSDDEFHSFVQYVMDHADVEKLVDYDYADDTGVSIEPTREFKSTVNNLLVMFQSGF